MIVESRCAITILVQPMLSRASEICRVVLLSSAEVASSLGQRIHLSARVGSS